MATVKAHVSFNINIMVKKRQNQTFGTRFSFSRWPGFSRLRQSPSLKVLSGLLWPPQSTSLNAEATFTPVWAFTTHLFSGILQIQMRLFEKKVKILRDFPRCSRNLISAAVLMLFRSIRQLAFVVLILKARQREVQIDQRQHLQNTFSKRNHKNDDERTKTSTLSAPLRHIVIQMQFSPCFYCCTCTGKQRNPSERLCLIIEQRSH